MSIFLSTLPLALHSPSSSLSALVFISSNIISTGALLSPGPRPIHYGFINNTHLYNLAKKFYAGCTSCRNPFHLSGLGTGIKTRRNVPGMAGLPLACTTTEFRKSQKVSRLDLNQLCRYTQITWCYESK